jgi:uncharacterized repeat protein (TIGR03803 family)
MRTVASFAAASFVSALSLQAQQIHRDYIESRSRQLPSPIVSSGLRGAMTAFAIVFVLMVVPTQAAQAQTYKVLYNFSGGQGGAAPAAGLTMDKAGNLYGTTRQGGGSGCGGSDCGTVFKLSRKGSGWVLNPLYGFQGGNDGSYPYGRLTIAPDGSLYGTTNEGGGSGCGGTGCGIIFNLKPSPRACTTALCPWTETVLYRFTGGSDGAGPVGDLIFDQAGNLYGGAGSGGMAGCYGYGCGVVYKLVPSNGSWTETVLYSLTGGNDGGSPGGGVIFDQEGNLYGVADYGGSVGRGTVYELMPSGSGWVENTLYSFDSGASGKEPIGSPVFDKSGNLDLATPNDTLDEDGTVYQLTKSNNNWTLGKLAVLSHQFVSGGVVLDAADNVYDTAVGDGRNTYGTVFMLTNGSWTEVVLHSFSSDCLDGCDPEGGVVLDGDGNVYGTTPNGGPYGYGAVWEITP